ncbi:MAG: ABC transporter ATP-binding protein [Armatimonadetes bacterium]|nr:ABC transporter ATP-binding protein [Armatimonadota bacterium]
MIQIQNASRWYGQIIGVNDITCEIGPGITALLGMNGAGKSTLLRLITGQLRPTTGGVKVFGHEPFGNPDVFKHLGYCPEIDNFYEYMSGFEFVRYMARLSGFSPAEAKSRSEEMIAHVGMTERAGRKIKGYSKGMRQRIKLAQAMVHDPDIILLDEPLNGLDPVARHEFLGVLESLARNGKTILVSSHILYEVEQMTRSILLLHRGRLLATGDLTVIRELIDKYPHKVRIETTEPRLVASKLTEMANIVSAKIDERNGEIQLEVRDPNIFYESLSTLVLEQNMPILSFNSPDNNLESVFQYLVEG